MNVRDITIASIERSLLNSVCSFWSLWWQYYGSFTVTYFQCSLVPIVVIGFSPYVAHLSIKYFSPYKPKTSLIIIIIIKSLSENCKKTTRTQQYRRPKTSLISADRNPFEQRLTTPVQVSTATLGYRECTSNSRFDTWSGGEPFIVWITSDRIVRFIAYEILKKRKICELRVLQKRKNSI